jgi:hypothetical protein
LLRRFVAVTAFESEKGFSAELAGVGQMAQETGILFSSSSMTVNEVELIRAEMGKGIRNLIFLSMYVAEDRIDKARVATDVVC